MFPRLKPTKNAQAQMLKTIEGATLRFSRVGLGNGERPSIDFEDITQMQNFVCFGNLTSYERNGTNAIIHWQLDCASVENAFDWTEYALFALDENDNEFLFSYAYNEGTPQPISSVNSESLVMLENDINICIGDAEHVSAIIGEYSAYASKETVEAHLNNFENPHKVDAEDIGLENVDNVSTNDATPTFKEAAELENINSGEKATILWGKVKKAISMLSAHISNKKNPHGTSAEDIGAAKTLHTHSASDINSGTLSVARGGTGTTDLATLLKKLITDSKQHIKLSNGRYLRGLSTDGAEHTLIGMGTDNNVYIGNDEAKYIHLHGNENICIRVIDGSNYKYFHINKAGTIYSNQINIASGATAATAANVGSSTYRYNTVYAKNALNTSDKKLKENITDAEIGLEILKRLSIVQFNFIGESEIRCGVIAQEVFKLFQELGIHNSGVYQASVVSNDYEEITDKNGNVIHIPKIHPELENLSDEEILKYNDAELTWNVNYNTLTYYCIAGFQKYMQATEQRFSKLENKIGGMCNGV